MCRCACVFTCVCTCVSLNVYVVYTLFKSFQIMYVYAFVGFSGRVWNIKYFIDHKSIKNNNGIKATNVSYYQFEILFSKLLHVCVCVCVCVWFTRFYKVLK